MVVVFETASFLIKVFANIVKFSFEKFKKSSSAAITFVYKFCKCFDIMPFFNENFYIISKLIKAKDILKWSICFLPCVVYLIGILGESLKCSQMSLSSSSNRSKIASTAFVLTFTVNCGGDTVYQLLSSKN